MTAKACVPGQPAGFWRRFFAGLFDLLCLMTAAVLLLIEIVWAIGLADYYGWLGADSLLRQVTLWLGLGFVWCVTSAVLLPVLYYTLCEGAWGQSAGKALFGIVVIAADGRPLGYGRALARLLTLPYAVLPLGLGLLWAALPPAKRGWHDYISATRVVDAAPSEPLQPTADQQQAIPTPG